MSDSHQRTEAERRVDKACDLIQSAYRLEPLSTTQTLAKVRTAIAWGAEQMAEDIAEELRK